MTFEEQDQVRAILKAEFKNYDVLEEEDMITLVLDHEDLAGGLRCYPSGPDIDRIPLTPGFCNVTSASGSKTSFTVDNIDQYFILEVDYAARNNGGQNRHPGGNIRRIYVPRTNNQGGLTCHDGKN